MEEEESEEAETQEEEDEGQVKVNRFLWNLRPPLLVCGLIVPD